MTAIVRRLPDRDNRVIANILKSLAVPATVFDAASGNYSGRRADLREVLSEERSLMVIAHRS